MFVSRYAVNPILFSTGYRTVYLFMYLSVNEQTLVHGAKRHVRVNTRVYAASCALALVYFVFFARRRRDGDRFRPVWRSRPSKLKDFFRGQGVPLHLRDEVAVICDQDDDVSIMYPNPTPAQR